MMRLVRSLLRVHSPSRGLMGTCRCRPCTKGRAERIMRGEPATLADAMVRAVVPIIPPRPDLYRMHSFVDWPPTDTRKDDR